MSDNGKTILVVGATGQQGGAVARHLLKDGWKVRALVRDPEKETAKALANQGAELVKGDLYDSASLDNALKGMYGAFSVQNFWLPDVGFDGEIKQGKLIADAAHKAGIQHFVYSSVGAAHRGMGQKHFESKWIIEQYIKELDLPHTILRPVAFMDNFEWKRVEISNGTYSGFGVAADKKTQLIAVDDIGAVAAVVFSNMEKYLGTTIEIAGDELTETEAAETFTKIIGRQVNLGQPQTYDDNFMSAEEQAAGINFFNGEAYTADIEGIRKIHPNLQTFEKYLQVNGWENLSVLPIPEKVN